jgi:hypothetical protein
LFWSDGGELLDGLDYPCRVPADAMNHCRGQRVQEMQAYEVQSRLTLDQAAPVHRLTVFCEDRKTDPVESRIKAGNPSQKAARAALSCSPSSS